jgi:hypothetical protein
MFGLEAPFILRFAVPARRDDSRDEVTLEDFSPRPVALAGRVDSRLGRTRATDVQRETLDDD